MRRHSICPLCFCLESTSYLFFITYLFMEDQYKNIIIHNFAYNVDSSTLNSTLHFSLALSIMIPLFSNKFDLMTKKYQQHRLFLVDDASLISYSMLFKIQKRIREIINTPTSPFKNINVIFYRHLFPVTTCKIFLDFSTNELTI